MENKEWAGAVIEGPSKVEGLLTPDRGLRRTFGFIVHLLHLSRDTAVSRVLCLSIATNNL